MTKGHVIVLTSVLLALPLTACMAAPPSTQCDRPLIYSVNPVGNGDFVGAERTHSPFNRYDELLWEKLTEVGGRSARVLASWREIEEEKGKWNWRSLDREIAQCREFDVEPVVLIVNIPAWVSPTGQKTHEYPPKEENAADFNHFITQLARRYKGKARYYEFWNEQNGFGWHVDVVDGKQQFNLAEEYVPWLYRCYKAIKAVDPDAQVAMGGLDDVGGHSPIYVKMCYELRRNRYNNEKFWDAIADHPYNKKSEETADRAIEKLDAIRAVAAQYGDKDIPLWITEYGWHAGEHTIDVQARGTRQFLERFAQPDQKDLLIAQQLCVSDFEPVHEGYGLCDLNLRPRPAFHEFQKLARPDVPSVRHLKVRHYPDRETVVTGELTIWPPAQGVRAHVEIIDEQGQTRCVGQIRRQRFEVELPRIPRDIPLLAELRVSGGRRPEHPFARLPILRPGDRTVPNPDFEEMFRAGIPWAWTPVGQAICRDGTVFGQDYCHNGKSSLMLMLFDNARHYRFDDRLEVPVVAAEGQRFSAACFSRYKTDVQTTPDIRVAVSLIDPAAPLISTAAGLEIGRDWTEVAAELTAPCDAPILAIHVSSNDLPRDDGKKRRWFVFIDSVNLTPAESRS